MREVNAPMPFLAKIKIHPVKALDPVDVQEARILAAGPLEHDRAFALFDGDGNYVNGKRCAAIHRVRAEFAGPNFNSMTLHWDGTSKSFDLYHDRAAIEAWLGAIL